MFNTSLALSKAFLSSSIALGIYTPSAFSNLLSIEDIISSNCALSITLTDSTKVSIASFKVFVIFLISSKLVELSNPSSAILIVSFKASTASLGYCPFPFPTTAFSTFSLAKSTIDLYAVSALIAS